MTYLEFILFEECDWENQGGKNHWGFVKERKEIYILRITSSCYFYVWVAKLCVCFFDTFPYWSSVTVGHEDMNNVFGLQAAKFIVFFFFLIFQKHLPTPEFFTQACPLFDLDLYRFWHPCELIREAACYLQELRKAILIKAVSQVCANGQKIVNSLQT